MRAALIVLTLLLTACTSNLRLHAQVASTSADVLNMTRDAIEREAAADYAHATATGGSVEKLREQYRPVEVAYEAARKAHELYVATITDAHARGEKTLRGAVARPLLGAWLKVAQAAEGLGIEVPEPSEAFVKLAGEGAR